MLRLSCLYRNNMLRLSCLHNNNMLRLSCLYRNNMLRLSCLHRNNMLRLSCLHSNNMLRLSCLYRNNMLRLSCLHRNNMLRLSCLHSNNMLRLSCLYRNNMLRLSCLHSNNMLRLSCLYRNNMLRLSCLHRNNMLRLSCLLRNNMLRLSCLHRNNMLRLSCLLRNNMLRLSCLYRNNMFRLSCLHRNNMLRLSCLYRNNMLRLSCLYRNNMFRLSCLNRNNITKCAHDQTKYREIKKLAQSECRKAYYEYINSMLDENNQNEINLKKFWSFIKSKKKENSGVDALMKNGTVHSDSQAKADILNMQFSSVFTIGNASNTPSLGVSPYSELPHITVCVAGVKKLLEGIKPHKATGPDGIPARLLKDYAADLAPVLSHIHQASLNQGRVPADWKHAWVIPVFKKGARNSPSNYRPISITSIACKTLEHIIHSNLMNHLERHNILSDHQQT